MSVSKTCLLVAAAALVSTAAFAGHNGSPIKSLHQSFAPRALKDKNEAFVVGNGFSTSLTQYNFTPIDAGTTFNCTRVCTISANDSAQMQTGGGDWAICILVDGADVECQYQGVQSGPSSFVVGNVNTAEGNLAIGSHTIQTELYTEGTSATYQYYSFDYTMHQ